MSSLHEVPVALTAAQLRSLKNGGAINIKPSMIREDAKTIIHLAAPHLKFLVQEFRKIYFE